MENNEGMISESLPETQDNFVIDVDCVAVPAEPSQLERLTSVSSRTTTVG